MSTFRKEIDKRFDVALAGVGFKRKKSGIYYHLVDDNLYLWLGLNVAKNSKAETVINPMFGVGLVDVETMLDKCLGDKIQKFLQPTFVINVGCYFEDENGGYTEFYFGKEDLDEDIKVFVDVIREAIGLAKEKYRDYATVRKGLNRYPPAGFFFERDLCLASLMGCSNIFELLEKQEKKMVGKHIAIRNQFDDFSLNFRSLVEGHTNST